MPVQKTASSTDAPATEAPALGQTRRTLLVMVAVAVGGTLASFLADGVVGSRARGAPEWLQDLGTHVNNFADWPWILGLGLVLLATGWIARNERLRRTVLCMLVAAIIAGLTANVVKYTTGRSRPIVAEEKRGWHGLYRDDGQLLLGKASYQSFPSGHTAFAVGFLWVVVLARTRWRWVAFALVPVVPTARLLTNSHHFSDVVAGTCLATIVAWLVVRKAGLT